MPSDDPKNLDDYTGPWRDGSMLVVRRDSTMPTRCMRCNAPTDCLNHVTLHWHPRHGKRGIGIRAGLDLLAESQSFPLCYGYCDAHRPFIGAHLASNLLGLLAGGLLVLGLLTTMAIKPGWPMVLIFLAAGIALLLAIGASLWPREARIVRISSGGTAYISGFDDLYLASLPELPAGFE